jgi:osmotically-inducible protein OsmY
VVVHKSDLQLKLDVEAELCCDPRVDAAKVGVSVDQGVVTLLGEVDTFAARYAVEDAVKRVHGVRAVALDLAVKLPEHHRRSDAELAAAVANALRWDVLVPGTVTARVEQGAVTLDGQVHWNFQRTEAERVVRHLVGVVSVANALTLKPAVTERRVREDVEAALQRQAANDAQTIHIEATGGKVSLTGHASSWRAVTEAVNAAWAAPGVTDVVTRLQVTSSD